MKRCKGPECDNIVHEERGTSVRIGNYVFCCNDCAKAWMQQNGLGEPTPLPTLQRVNGG